MKKLVSILFALAICICACISFSACAEGSGKYIFYGMLDSDGTTIIKKADMSSELKEYIESESLDNTVIRLNVDNTFSWTTSVGDDTYMISTTYNGTYSIEEDKLNLTFSSSGFEKDKFTSNYSYDSGRIIIFDGVSGIYLVYAK